MGWFWNPGEFIAVGTLGPMPTDRPGIGCLPGYVTEASSRDREHVTEKPPRVCAWLVSVVTHGGTVLDPFAGSGAIGEAALLSGRQYIGIETEPAYLDIAARRLESIEAAGVQIGLPMGQDEEREQTTLL
ncbi:MAG: DNA methyltransferase [Thermoleophilia bacterium]